MLEKIKDLLGINRYRMMWTGPLKTHGLTVHKSSHTRSKKKMKQVIEKMNYRFEHHGYFHWMEKD